MAERTLAEDRATATFIGTVAISLSVFFNAIRREIAKINFATTGTVSLFFMGLILMMCEVDSDSLALFVAIKLIGLVIFSLSVFILRRIDPDSWLNPWERRGKK
ncbi:MAG: hypothetical protein WC582_04690 [Patescibacteria group bacterium]